MVQGLNHGPGRNEALRVPQPFPATTVVANKMMPVTQEQPWQQVGLDSLETWNGHNLPASCETELPGQAKIDTVCLFLPLWCRFGPNLPAAAEGRGMLVLFRVLCFASLPTSQHFGLIDIDAPCICIKPKYSSQS